MRALLGCAVALVICAGLSAEDKAEKIDAKKLVGRWEPKDAPKGVSAVVEFAKDGKVTFTVSQDGKEAKYEGTYKVDDDKLTATLKGDGKEETQKRTIIKLTDAELVTKDDKGKERAFTRVTGKK